MIMTSDFRCACSRKIVTVCVEWTNLCDIVPICFGNIRRKLGITHRSISGRSRYNAIHSSFSIIPYFLPNRGRILQVLMEMSKIKKNCPYWGLNLRPPDHQSNALLTVLARNLLVACVNHSAFIKLCSIDFYSEQSSTCEVVHEANKSPSQQIPC